MVDPSCCQGLLSAARRAATEARGAHPRSRKRKKGAGRAQEARPPARGAPTPREAQRPSSACGFAARTTILRSLQPAGPPREAPLSALTEPIRLTWAADLLD